MIEAPPTVPTWTPIPTSKIPSTVVAVPITEIPSTVTIIYF